MATKKTRGSDKLAASLSSAQAKKLDAVLTGWKVIDWHILGQPAPELLTARLSGGVGKVGGVVNKLLKLKEVRDIEILINGTPRPDLAHVRFKMRTGPQR
jgi:hypothetical protein